MHQKLLGAVAAVAIVTALSGPAAAADLAPVKAPPLAPVPQLVSWTGFYVGGNVGWGRSNFSLIGNDDSVCEIECRIRGTGLALGFHAGYNWQIGAWLVGLEGDVTLTPGWEQTACPGGGPCSSPAVARNDWLSSVRGRLGWTFDRTLIYATGGVAFAKQKLSACSTETCGNLTHVTTGGVVGGGIEWKYNPNFSLRAEGLYYMFRASNAFNVDCCNDIISSGGLKNIAVFRVGASWHPQPW